MNLEQESHQRSTPLGESCKATNDLQPFTVCHQDQVIVLMKMCQFVALEVWNKWKTPKTWMSTIGDASTTACGRRSSFFVQVVAWRMLNRLRAEGLATGFAGHDVFDDETLEWAKANRGRRGSGRSRQAYRQQRSAIAKLAIPSY
ncbi:MAG: hypothetical protein R2788_27200 [Saprospiraceae bacterium]